MTHSATPALLSDAGGIRRTTWTILTISVIFALHDLGSRSLHDLDTARWGTLAREMIRTGEWLVPTRYGELYANKPPLYLWAVALPSALFGGVHAFWVRLPAALGFVLLVMSTVRWARMRTGSESVARLAGLLALSTFSVAWLSREGRLDMMGAGLAMAATASWDAVASGRGTKRTRWHAGLWLGAALLTKGPPLLLLPIAVLFAPVAGQSIKARLKAARIPQVLGTAIGIALLWFIPAVISGGWAYGRLLLVDQAANRISGAGNHQQSVFYYLKTIATQMAPWGPLYLAALFGVLHKRVRASLGPTAPIVVAGLVVVLVFSLIPTKHIRYMAPIMPAFALGVAWWGEQWLRREPVSGWNTAWHKVAVICGVGAIAAIGLAVTSPRPGAWLAASVPFAALLWVGWRVRPDVTSRPARLRREAVTGALLAVTAFVLLACVFRHRFRERLSEQFNVAVEAQHEDEPVFVLHPMRPQDVFEGASNALLIGTVDDLPAGESWVVLEAAALPTLNAVRGAVTTVVPPMGKHAWTVVRVPGTISGD